MRKTLLILAAIAILTSCKKNDTKNIEEPEKLSSDIEVLVKGATQETQSLYERPKEHNFLGFGYDATDQYNDEASVRRSVVDVRSYAASRNDGVITLRGTQVSGLLFMLRMQYSYQKNFPILLKKLKVLGFLETRLKRRFL